MTEILDPKLKGADPSGLPSSDKTVTLQLSWIAAAKAYKIIAVTNTTYYKPDMWLMEKDAATLAGMKGYQFSATSPDYIGMLLGLVKNLPLPIL